MSGDPASLSFFCFCFFFFLFAHFFLLSSAFLSSSSSFPYLLSVIDYCIPAISQVFLPRWSPSHRWAYPPSPAPDSALFFFPSLLFFLFLSSLPLSILNNYQEREKSLCSAGTFLTACARCPTYTSSTHPPRRRCENRPPVIVTRAERLSLFFCFGRWLCPSRNIIIHLNLSLTDTGLRGKRKTMVLSG